MRLTGAQGGNLTSDERNRQREGAMEDIMDEVMEDIHNIFTTFKKEFPEINEQYEALGEEIHLKGGPLPDTTRWLIKVAVSGAGRHERALQTHIHKARSAGASDEEIAHALLLLIPTCGFPTFMEAYRIFRGEAV